MIIESVEISADPCDIISPDSPSFCPQQPSPAAHFLLQHANCTRRPKVRSANLNDWINSSSEIAIIESRAWWPKPRKLVHMR